MRRRWVLAAALLIVGRSVALRAEEKTAEPRPTIAVTGQGEVKAAPDLVVASFAVETTGPRATEAAAENAKRSAAVAAALKALLAPEDTVGTTRYTVEPRYESVRPGEAHEPRITATWRATRARSRGGGPTRSGLSSTPRSAPAPTAWAASSSRSRSAPSCCAARSRRSARTPGPRPRAPRRASASG